MKTLLIFNRAPYDDTDVTWNGLRLLMNDAVDMARDACKPPEGSEDVSQMLKDLIADNVLVKVCGTCMSRCGIYKNHPYFEGAEKSTMQALSEWIIDSDKVLTF